MAAQNRAGPGPLRLDQQHLGAGHGLVVFAKAYRAGVSRAQQRGRPMPSVGVIQTSEVKEDFAYASGSEDFGSLGSWGAESIPVDEVQRKAEVIDRRFAIGQGP